MYSKKIERIQRKFTRRLYYKFNIRKADYEIRLITLNMQKLTVRRSVFDELYLFKIMNGYVVSDLRHKFVLASNPYDIRDLPTFRLPTPRTNIRFKCPSYRLQDNHNRSFNRVNIVNGLSIIAFKSLIQREWF